DDDVDAVRPIADVLVDPLELDLELAGLEADGAEDAEAAGAAHRRDDVTAVAEGEDRELDAKGVAEGSVHGRSSRREAKSPRAAGSTAAGRPTSAPRGSPGSAGCRR